MGRSPCCDATDLKRGPWTTEEDQKLLAYIQENGHGRWRSLPQKAGLKRCGKSCRLRWANYLRPDIKRGNFNFWEEQTIIQLHARLGNRWSAIAKHLPKRTDNEIKNYWNTHLKKRLAKTGINPVTHKPADHDSKNVANLSHTVQWKCTKLEAEARLARESKLHQHQRGSAEATSSSAQLLNKMATAIAPPRCRDILKAYQGVLSRSMQDYGSNHNGCNIDSPTSTLSLSDNGSTVSAIRSSGGETVEACAMQHQENVFDDAGEAWIDEVNFNYLLSDFLLSDLDDDERNPSVGRK